MNRTGIILTIIGIIWTAIVVSSVAANAQHVHVRDGDTIVVGGTPIRLKGLSCAENKTDMGKAQTAYLKQWVSTASSIDCQLTGETTYDRQVGWCEIDGYDVGEIMITNAYCQPCRRYDSTGKYDHLPVTGATPNYCKE